MSNSQQPPQGTGSQDPPQPESLTVPRTYLSDPKPTRQTDDPNYLSNEKKAQATHDRIMNEAKNACHRLIKDTSENSSQFYVTPALNSYYRRLVHLLANGEAFVNKFPGEGTEGENLLESCSVEGAGRGNFNFTN
jgi:hypothetical protein